MKKLLIALMAMALFTSCDSTGSWLPEPDPTYEYSKEIRVDTMSHVQVYIDRDASDIWIRRETEQGSEYLHAITITDSNIATAPIGIIIIIFVFGMIVGIIVAGNT